MSCYVKRNGLISNQTAGAAPCGPVGGGKYTNCCWQGHTCLSNGFCQAPWRPGTTGYYIGACTDPEYKDPSCRQECVAEQLGDVIPNFYNTDKGGVNSTWTCCGADTNDNVFCDRPQGANFTALATDQLYATAAILQNPIRVSVLPAAVIASASASVVAKDASMGVTATNTVSATATQSSVATSNQSTLPASDTNAVAGVQASPSQSSSSQTLSTAQASAGHALSPAAIAGIIFGIIAFLSLIAAGFFLVYRIGQAKAQKGMRTEAETSAFSSQEKGGEMYKHPQKQLSEMSDDQRPFEMGDGYCAELATPLEAKQTHQKQASVGIEQYLKMKL